MIIDSHGHYTTAPDALGDYRDVQKAALKKDPSYTGEKGVINITDDQIRETIENGQLKLQRERGTDATIFSPRASWRSHTGFTSRGPTTAVSTWACLSTYRSEFRTKTSS